MFPFMDIVAFLDRFPDQTACIAAREAHITGQRELAPTGRLAQQSAPVARPRMGAQLSEQQICSALIGYPLNS
jgi:hypothetical protein